MSPAPLEPAVKPRPRGDRVERRRAVVVGVDDYVDPALHLEFCAADAIRMAEVLRARGFEVSALHDGPGVGPAPTRAAVVAAIDAVTAASDEDDLVFVYLSCHGHRVERRPHLLLADTPGGDRGIAEGGLPLAELLDRLRGRARWVAIFLDVCRMGLGLDPTTGRSMVHSEEQGGGFALLAGSTSGSIAQDTASGGIFSKCLLEGLAGAAADADGGMRFSALARHVQAGVARWRTTGEGALKMSSQRPVLRLEVADLQLFPARDHVALTPRVDAAITCAAFSGDGLRLVTGDEGGAVRIWDPRTGAQVAPPCAHGPAVRAVDISLAGFIASASDDGVVKTWLVGSGEAMPPENRFGAAVRAVLWSDTGLGRVIGAASGLWCQHVKDIILSVTDPPWSEAAVRALAPAPGGFVTGADSGEVRWWQGSTKQSVLLGTLRGPVAALAVSPDGRYVAACVDARRKAKLDEPRLFDCELGTELRLEGHPAGATALACAPDGARFATASRDGSVRLFDAAGGELRRTITLEPEAGAARSPATVVRFAPDGRALFVGHGDGRGRLVLL